MVRNLLGCATSQGARLVVYCRIKEVGGAEFIDLHWSSSPFYLTFCINNL